MVVSRMKARNSKNGVDSNSGKPAGTLVPKSTMSQQSNGWIKKSDNSKGNWMK
ncbi:hypothetical protein CCACVL1_07537 [Corchorus capsularis]|uniref:Uncharacterized protein n=1 Tax=Corchorus capsularis TaxID=210143 RepID=A0A1R3J5I4_COCAP|nr:hypothetical protein CCACVL1_07537 [Corchorus capsularis]